MTGINELLFMRENSMSGVIKSAHGKEQEYMLR